MSYTKLTDFAAKDALLSGNPSKLLRGTEIDAEFTSIAADSVSKDATIALKSATSTTVTKTSTTGAALIPAGTTAERPTPAFGHQRANSTTGLMEWWNGTIWTQMGGGATGSGGDQVFYENDTVVNTDHTISRNSSTVGPLEIASGKTLTINSGKRLVVL